MYAPPSSTSAGGVPSPMLALPPRTDGSRGGVPGTPPARGGKGEGGAGGCEQCLHESECHHDLHLKHNGRIA